MATVEFLNYRCWGTEWVSSALDVDADSVEDALFMATHTDPQLHVDLAPSASSLSADNLQVRSTREVLEMFLDGNRRHVQMVVIGEPGTGKSHLIKWMDLAIPENDYRVKIRVPRAGNTLRGVLRLIIDVLPEDMQQQYLVMVDRGGSDTPTDTEKMNRILLHIAIAIPSVKPEGALESMIIGGLPNLFQDPNFGSVLRERSPIIKELAQHVFDTPDAYERRTSPREFRADDLSLDASTMQSFASDTQGILRTISFDPDLVQAAVNIVNRSLNTAIAGALSFSGESLIDLVRDVRKYLKQQNKELIILVEDMVRNQGYDQPLLDALMERANQDNELCTVRWGMAVTTGYYANILPTNRERMDFVINMDAGASENSFSGIDTAAFVARYMNAVRFGPDYLRGWYAENSKEIGNETLTSYCVSECQFREQCHASFGHDGDRGLYPLTSDAVLNIAERAGAIGERNNPRALLRALSLVLDAGAVDLDEARFPSRHLFDSIRGMQETQSPPLSPNLTQALQLGGAEHAERQQVLVELWSRTPGLPTQIDEPIFEAFGIPAPSEDVYSDAPPICVDDNSPPDTGTAPQDATVQRLNSWFGGSTLDDRNRAIANLIRDAIEDHIDWDNVGLVKSELTAKTGTQHPFTNRSIEFRRQAVQWEQVTPVHLILPADADDEAEMSETVLALIGLRRFNRTGSWSHEGGAGQMVALANRLDAWSEHVVSRLRQIVSGDKEWSPAIAARELLSVGALLGGHSGIYSGNSAERLESCFIEWNDPPASASQSWQALYQMISSQRERLVNVGVINSTGSKGGTQSSFLVPREMTRTIDRMATSWKFTQTPPENLSGRRGDFGDIGSTYTQAIELFENLTQGELQLRRHWLEAIRAEIEPGTRRQQIIVALQEMDQARKDRGLPGSSAVFNVLARAVERFGSVQFDAAVSSTESLLRESDVTGILAGVSADRSGNARGMATELLAAANAYFDEAESSTASEMRRLGIDSGDGVLESKTQIRSDLTDLSDLFDRLEGNNAS